MIPLMSNSLKVVNMALVFCASFNRPAIFCLIRFILTRCSDLVPAISLVGSAGGIRTTGAAPAAGAAGGGGGGRMAATGVEATGSVGGLGAAGGAAGMAPAAGAAGAAGGGGGGGAAAGSAAAAGLGLAGAAPPAPTLILTSFIPGFTVLPSSTKSSSMTPAHGDGTGTEVLSVSTSQMTSSSVTASPTAFSQRKSPSVMDSAKAGHVTTLISSKRIDEVLSVLVWMPLMDDNL